MYLTDNVYEILKVEAIKRDQSIHRFARMIIEDYLGKKSNIMAFHVDALCPKCKSEGEIVEDYDGNIICLKCGLTVPVLEAAHFWHLPAGLTS